MRPDGRPIGRGDLAPAGGRFHGGCAPHSLFETSKRKPSRGASLAPAGQFTFCAAPGGKEKMFGGSVRMYADLLPPAGDGWRSLAAVRDGDAQPLGKPPARGSLGHFQFLFPLPLTLPRKTRQRVAERNARKEKLFKCDLAPRRPPHHPPRDGSIDLAEDSSVPEGQPKSEQAPVRRPPCARRATAPERAWRLFLFHRARRILFLAQPKREWGAHPPWERPPAGAESSDGRLPPLRCRLGKRKKGRPALRPAASRFGFTPGSP